VDDGRIIIEKRFLQAARKLLFISPIIFFFEYGGGGETF